MNDKKSPKQQIVEKIKSAKNILLTTHVNPDGDAIGSILALHHTLKKLGKNTSMACSGKKSDKHQFLPDFNSVNNELSGAKQFVITLNTSNTEAPHKVKYQTEENKIHLIITPEGGNFSQEDVSFKEGKHQFDLIIVTDTPNLERLDKIYEDHNELFFETPIINIDHHGDNESFGEANFIDSKSSSVCEMIVSIIEALSTDKPLMDEKIATCVLTGILDDTSSFQNNNTTSKSLTVAAQMMASGAAHLDIIKNIFKTQPLSKLKIWGKVLTKLQTKPSLKLAWSTISLADLQEAEATPDETSGVIDALIRNLPDTNVFMLMVQTEELIKGSLRSNPPININAIATELGGGGHAQASGFRIYDKTLSDAEELVLNTIEKHLSNVSPLNVGGAGSDFTAPQAEKSELSKTSPSVEEAESKTSERFREGTNPDPETVETGKESIKENDKPIPPVSPSPNIPLSSFSPDTEQKESEKTPTSPPNAGGAESEASKRFRGGTNPHPETEETKKPEPQTPPPSDNLPPLI